MQDYQLRVIAEKEALDENIAKLQSFLDKLAEETDETRTVSLEEVDRLQRQCDAMNGYSRVLAERITAFGDPIVPDTAENEENESTDTGASESE